MSRRKVDTDVLVVGGGGAATMAAVHAKKTGLRTTLVCKGRVGKSGCSILVGGGFSISGEAACNLGQEGDAKWTNEKLFRRIILEGFFLNNQKLVEAFCRDGGTRVKELIGWGLNFTFGRPGSFRVAHPPASGGAEIGKICKEGVKKHDIQLFEDVMVAELLIENGRCIGALGIDINTGDFIIFEAKAVVLATGGWHRAYGFNSGTRDLTGDGQRMAYEAGAELVNMEMVTFCPGAILWPLQHRGSIFGYTMHARMLNSRGDNIMSYFDPKVREIADTTEFNKNIWSIAIARQLLSNRGTPHGGVWWTIQGLPLEVLEYAQRSRPAWKWQGEDFSELMEGQMKGHGTEVGNAAHYFEGGISINEKCETNVQGLFAAGECTSGTFGANRVCDATVEMIVLGSIAGESAAKYAETVASVHANVERIEALENKLLLPLDRFVGTAPKDITKRINAIADSCVGVIRSESELKRAIKEIQRIRENELQEAHVAEKNRAYNMEWISSIEIENMLLCIEASTKAALMRTESRGVHYRSDYPMMDNKNWLREIVVKKIGEEMQLTTRPVQLTSFEPPSEIANVSWDDYLRWVVPKLKQLEGE